MFLFIFERETEHEWGRGRERERDTQNLKQAPGSVSTEPHTGLDSGMARSCPEPKRDA